MSSQTEVPEAVQTAGLTKTAPTPSEASYTIKVRLGELTQVMDYQEAFVLAHDLLKRSKYAVAASIFERLCQVTAGEPRAHILLAICEAGLSRYSIAFKVLNKAAFDDALLAADVYDAIVQARMGFKEDALQKVLRIVNDHKELPTLNLWLGDMYESTGQTEKAIQCWQCAIESDRSKGAVTRAAKRQILRLTKQIATLTPDMTQPMA